MLGRRVKSENIANNSSGKLSYRWDGTDFDLSPLPSGIYFVRVNNEIAAAKEKIVLLK